MNLKTIEIEEYFPHPAAKVWRALTDRELMSRWLMGSDFDPRVGAKFSFDTGGWGTTQCEVLELKENEFLSYSWKNPPLDTVITWQLESRDGGTVVRMEHSGFDIDDPQQQMAFEGMGHGWGDIAKRLATCLDEMATAAS